MNKLRGLGERRETSRIPRRTAAATVALVTLASSLAAQEAYKRTDSRRPYAHHLELVDAEGRKFDPRVAGAPPFSMRETCKPCHDVAAIEHGWHFNAASTDRHGRVGEPWIWTDERTGTQLPLSYRGWPGTRRPDEVGMDALGFFETFGRHLPGGARPYADARTDAGRFRITGDLPIDCMVCHSASRAWSHERWAATVGSQDFAWASAVAMGLATIEGSVKTLPDDLDVTGEEGQALLPKTTYDPRQIDAEGQVFFDVVRRPSNDACYTCHTVRPVGESADPRWLEDEDVHLRAGMLCVDCHRNGIEHHTVRGYEGEEHPAGEAVASLTCRGCHVGGEGVGRLGAPNPSHAGIPLVHFEKLSCTACHSGPLPDAEAVRVQTSMAHALGIPSQVRQNDDLPGIVEPVFRANGDGVIEPVRMTWPSFWGYETAEGLVPLRPDEVFPTLRRILRVRTRLRPELQGLVPDADDRTAVLGAERAAVPETGWTDAERAAMAERLVEKVSSEFFERMAKALAALQANAPEGGTAVAVSGGEVYRLDESGTAVRSGTHADAEPYAWPLAHPVRPARQSLGVAGCTDCHAAGAPFVHGTVTAIGPAPDTSPRRTSMLETMALDPAEVAAWEASFLGRDLFKIVVVATSAIVALLLLLGALSGLDAVMRRRRAAVEREEAR